MKGREGGRILLWSWPPLTWMSPATDTREPCRNEECWKAPLNSIHGLRLVMSVNRQFFKKLDSRLLDADIEVVFRVRDLCNLSALCRKFFLLGRVTMSKRDVYKYPFLFRLPLPIRCRLSEDVVQGGVPSWLLAVWPLSHRLDHLVLFCLSSILPLHLALNTTALAAPPQKRRPIGP